MPIIYWKKRVARSNSERNILDCRQSSRGSLGGCKVSDSERKKEKERKTRSTFNISKIHLKYMKYSLKSSKKVSVINNCHISEEFLVSYPFSRAALLSSPVFYSPPSSLKHQRLYWFPKRDFLFSWLHSSSPVTRLPAPHVTTRGTREKLARVVLLTFLSVSLQTSLQAWHP